MATASRVGGMVSDVSADTLDALTQFGLHLGMCFQVVDDVLDLTSSDEALGKPAGQDLLEGVYTLPVIYALDESDELRALLGTPIDAERLPTVRELATANGAVDAALAVARDHAVKASEALAGADDLDPKVTGGLCRLVDGLVTRDK
jgi:geranylgeranyl pyrophosphate synthase